jgi:predicted DCC family thiol-disulfide oxidoreductase YuxK
MKPILIYDGYCNLCIRVVKLLEPTNRLPGGDFNIRFIPFQKADDLIAHYQLDPEQLQSALHFISADEKVSKAGDAISKLADYFPLLKLGSGFLTTELGEKLYRTIATHRYGIFGCTDECYISEFYQSPVSDTKTLL